MSRTYSLRAGFGMAEVNPWLGMPMEGLWQQEGCRTIHDDLFVRALAMDDGRGQALIVGFDLLFFERALADRYKASLHRALGLTPERILLNTSHTHAGPRITRWAYGGEADPAYLDKIEAGLLRAAAEAVRRLRSVRLEAGAGLTDMPVSRRVPRPDGKVYWGPYPPGEVCRALPFCFLRDRRDAVIALLFSVSCHPSMIHTPDISAEYPGAAMRRLNEHFRTGGALFLQGAGGDAKPCQIAAPECWRQGTWQDMEDAGRSVADALIRAAAAGLRPIAPELRAALIETRWPLAAVSGPAELEAIRDDGQTAEGRRAWARDCLHRLTRLGALPEAVGVLVHGLQIGRGLRLIGFEGELVGELGNLVLRRYRDGVTFPLGYTNGAQIYLPSSRQIPQGGYEVDNYWEYHWPAPLAGGTDGIVARAIRKLSQTGRFAVASGASSDHAVANVRKRIPHANPPGSVGVRARAKSARTR